MRSLLGAIGIASLTIACSAEAKDVPTADQADKPVCKRVYDADLGSHFSSSKRICHTALEWKEIEDADARALQALRDHGGLASPAPGVGPSSR